MLILDLLLENVEQHGPNLSHLLLGLTPSGIPHPHGAELSPSACLEAVVGLLKNPATLEQESRLAEKW